MPEPDGGCQQPGLTEPPTSVWTALGLTPVSEVHAGHQSRVFVATGQNGRLIVKLIEAGNTDAFARRRLEVTRQLADINPAVVGPIALGSELMTEIDRWQVACYPYVGGTKPDSHDRGDVEAMAATLATLHDSLATLTEAELPPVTALQETMDERLRNGQIIHGDYGDANLIVTPGGLRIIDFADCGHGSVEFEIGNGLYLVLFDAWRSGDRHHYDHFRSWFVDEYRSAAPNHLDDALLDEAIEVRARALGRWLIDPGGAPTGIRTASPKWREQLRPFVDDVVSRGIGRAPDDPPRSNSV